MGQHMYHILQTARSCKREDLTIIFFFHEELVIKDFISTRKIKTVGNMVDQYFDPMGLATTLLWTHVEESNDEEEENKYFFVTNKWNGYPAKSPRGMFASKKIVNDLDFVIKKVKEYADG